MIRNISILLSVLILVAFVVPADAQSSMADHVVINEVDINPPGDDFSSPKEWVELYNPTENDVDIGGWKIASIFPYFEINCGTNRKSVPNHC